MAEDEIKQILINGRMVGIAGWDKALKKAAANHETMNDEDIKNALLAEVSPKNYIPSSASSDYGRALLREFKKERGIPVEEETVSGLQIAVLGMSCARCSQLENDVRELLSEMQIAADLRHITDANQLAHYGVMGAPALVINNKVVSVGDVPPKSKIRQWIIEAYPAPLKKS